MDNKLKSDSALFKSVLTLITGSGIAQVITLGVSPVLTRLYAPEDFGIFAFFMAIVSFLSIFSTLRYELAVMLPKKEAEAFSVITLSFVICIVVSSIAFIGTAIFVIVKSDVSFWFLLIPVFVFLLGVYQIFSNWSNRNRFYKKIAQSRIANALLTSVFSIFGGLLKVGTAGLIIGNMVGAMAGAYVIAELKILQSKLRTFNKSEIKEVALKYKSLPQTNIFQALVDLFQLNGLVYFIPFFFNSVILGYYSFALRILQAPVSFVGSSIAQVFYQKATETYHQKGDLNGLVRKTILRSALIALPLPLILILFGPDLFAFVFSEKWRIAGHYAQILSPWIYFDFIRSTISQLPIILHKQKTIICIFNVWGADNYRNNTLFLVHLKEFRVRFVFPFGMSFLVDGVDYILDL